MKLIHHISYRMLIALTLVLSVWAAFFYTAIMDEVNDEVDDSLEDYADIIIRRSLGGDELPQDKNTNNQYYLTLISASEAAATPIISYKDSMVYIQEKKETEPARVLDIVYRDSLDRYLKLTVLTPAIEKHDLIEELRNWLLFLYATLLVVLIGCNVWLFKKSLKPFYTLMRWIDRYKLGSSHEPLNNLTNVTEFKRLNEAVIRSFERNEKLFEKQKQFIGDVSHEVQTPLAITIGRLEMLMEDETMNERQLEELYKAHRDLEYLTNLNKSLLLLAKIDNSQFTDLKLINMGELLSQYLPDYQEIYSLKEIDVKVEKKSDFTVYMSETLASVLLTNLLKNSFVHTPEHGAIHINIDQNIIVFSNTAEEGALDGDKIFRRFYKREGKGSSSGLGLAIAMSISKQYNLRLSYSYQSGFHRFRLERI